MGIFVKRRGTGKPRISAKKSKSKKVRLPYNLLKLQQLKRLAKDPANWAYLNMQIKRNLRLELARMQVHTGMGKFSDQAEAKADSTLTTTIRDLPGKIRTFIDKAFNRLLDRLPMGPCSRYICESPVLHFATLCPRPTIGLGFQFDRTENRNVTELLRICNGSADCDEEREGNDEDVQE